MKNNYRLFMLIIFLTVATISFASISNSSAASTLYVNNNTGNDSYDGESPTFTGGINGPKSTIQDAINTIDPNGTVHVANGTYIEHITINKNVNLIGESQKGTIIDGQKTGTTIKINKNQNLNLTNLTIQNGNQKESTTKIVP